MRARYSGRGSRRGARIGLECRPQVTARALQLADQRLRGGVPIIEQQGRPGMRERGVQLSGLALDLGQLTQEVGALRRRLDGARPRRPRGVEVVPLPRGACLGDQPFDHLQAQRFQPRARGGPLRIGGNQRLERADRLDITMAGDERLGAAGERRQVTRARRQCGVEAGHGAVDVARRQARIAVRGAGRVERRGAADHLGEGGGGLLGPARLQARPAGVVALAHRRGQRHRQRLDQLGALERGERRRRHSRGRRQLLRRACASGQRQRQQHEPDPRWGRVDHRAAWSPASRASHRRGTSASIAMRPAAASWLSTRACR